MCLVLSYILIQQNCSKCKIIRMIRIIWPSSNENNNALNIASVTVINMSTIIDLVC